MTKTETPIFERGDVVFGDDPFKTDEGGRPWLILSNHSGNSAEVHEFTRGRKRVSLS